ncbi:MAG: preprotein translocase subunit SecG [bacterium]|nr:preprotein translocase subunit SecG [bacterium]
MNNILTILQVIVSAILIALVLLQQRGAGLGSAFGGGSGGGSYLKRRGMEKNIVTGTIISAIIFVLLAILNLIF